MTTIDTIGTISEDGHLTVKLPDKLPAGEHRVVVVFDIVLGPKERAPLTFAAYPAAPTAARNTFRREDIYGDDGR